jgi:hypothetical protein
MEAVSPFRKLIEESENVFIPRRIRKASEKDSQCASVAAYFFLFGSFLDPAPEL